jgi:histidyl-tRNA synthetase
MNKIVKQPNKYTAKGISNQPYKGARDFFPEDMRIRNYIFDTWKMVCKRYGFEEYDFPIVEPLETFAAKSGEEIVNNQLFSFEDKAGRKIALRPELTPGTVRMIAQKFNELQKPLRWFMIGNNWRFEKPQLGRGREFYQLEANIFGVNNVTADFEIFSLIIDIMRTFKATQDMFKVLVSDRRLISALLNDLLKLDSDLQVQVRRLMDKRKKMEKQEFLQSLYDLGLDKIQGGKIEDFMNSNLDTIKNVIPQAILDKNLGFTGIIQLFELLKKNNLDEYCQFDPSIIRGFDYSDGLVYEVFDKNPQNRRSMFGGERFDKLINIFGNYNLPATGFAMGDYTLSEFLKGWNLIPTLSTETKVYVTIFDAAMIDKSFQITKQLRQAGIETIESLEVGKLDKQLKYADRKGIPYAIIIGPDEVKKGKVQLKDLRAKKQEEMTLAKVIEKLAN